MNNSNTGKENKTSISIRMQRKHKVKIQGNAKKCNMSVSEYMISSALNQMPDYVIHKAPEVLNAVSELSNYINEMDDCEGKDVMKKNVLKIWRLLNMDYKTTDNQKEEE